LVGETHYYISTKISIGEHDNPTTPFAEFTSVGHTIDLIVGQEKKASASKCSHLTGVVMSNETLYSDVYER